jgi:hypothetical protein
VATKPLADELWNQHKSFDAANSIMVGARRTIKLHAAR